MGQGWATQSMFYDIADLSVNLFILIQIMHSYSNFTELRFEAMLKGNSSAK